MATQGDRVPCRNYNVKLKHGIHLNEIQPPKNVITYGKIADEVKFGHNAEVDSEIYKELRDRCINSEHFNNGMNIPEEYIKKKLKNQDLCDQIEIRI